MRRCPVCDFIYEDDDKLCAMDGTGLVKHRGPLAFEETALPQLAPPTNSHGRGLTLIVSGVILAIALFLYFHNVSRRNMLPSNPRATKTYNSSQPGDRNPIVVTPVEPASPFIFPSPAFGRTPEKTDAPRKSYRGRQPDDKNPFRAVETATPLPRPLPSFTPARAKVDVPSDKSVSPPVKLTPPLSASDSSATSKKDVKPTDNNQKNESRITSFLKKAGRALKKPFKH